ncbi:MAG: hypothetical protein WBD09_07315 [Halobacteriota archaeon]
MFENRSQAIRHAVRSFIKMDKGLIRFIDGASAEWMHIKLSARAHPRASSRLLPARLDMVHG